MKRIVILAVIIIPALMLLTGCERLKELRETMKEQREETAKTAEVADPDNVTTVFAVNTTRAVKGEILDYLEVNGDVMTATRVDIFADTAGKLTKLDIRLGDNVEKDQVIAEVDPSRPGMTFVASPVKSPIAGTITEIPVRIGATINQAVPIAKISKMDEIEIRTEVAERFISKIRLGLNALLHFEAYPDTRFQARVIELGPVVNPNTRTMEVRLNLWQRDQRIKSGMFAEVKIITERKEGIVKVPADCLVKRYGGYYVFVVGETNKVEQRKVTPGIQIDEKLEIVEGLQPDEEIVIRGQSLLEDGTTIRIIERVQPLDAQDFIE